MKLCIPRQFETRPLNASKNSDLSGKKKSSCVCSRFVPYGRGVQEMELSVNASLREGTSANLMSFSPSVAEYKVLRELSQCE